MTLAEPIPAPEILQQLHREMGSVLYIAAHPDDENTELITCFARGRNYRTAYLSLTRGDGGQNMLGPEFGNDLGVIRTQELLAARRIDGGRQFFSRAIDFGFSKDYRETLRRHHTASTALALEAFKLAGDPQAFPEQRLKPWQPKRILWNESIYQLDDIGRAQQVRIDIDGHDPVSGERFVDIAGRSRSMHKSQGFGNFTIPGRSGLRFEIFQLLDGAPMTKDVLDGVDTTWSRVPGGAKIGKLADEIIAQFDSQNPAASVPELLKLRYELTALSVDDPVVVEKRAQLDRILQVCLGLEVQTTIERAEVVPGEKMQLHHLVVIHSSIPVRWIAVRYPAIKNEIDQEVVLPANRSRSLDSTQTLPVDTPLSQPYWLREEGTEGLSRVGDPSLIGRPENPPAFPVEWVFQISGQTLVIPDEAVPVTTNSANSQIRGRLEVIPPVSLAFVSDIALLAPGTSHPVAVEIVASRADSTGILRLEAPHG